MFLWSYEFGHLTKFVSAEHQIEIEHDILLNNQSAMAKYPYYVQGKLVKIKKLSNIDVIICNHYHLYIICRLVYWLSNFLLRDTLFIPHLAYPPSDKATLSAVIQ